ncbi:helix-turn-helix domain-containing protein [Thalassovita sp.]|uniref:helix-turn-helix domain-containing protein n=1 Tax=Thalassovita sp. TaxID=1979401 RepID=UPI002B275FB2|nr:helix-turn-helix domain-containing protein [Thalassovita sp.]
MTRIPAYALYGEQQLLPDLLHCERILDRAGPNGWTISAHRHPHVHQLFLIRRGSAVLGVDGNRRDLNEPVVINMPRWTVHSFSFSKGTDGYVLTLPTAELPELFGQPNDLAERLEHWGLLPANDVICALFDSLHHEHCTDDPGRSLMLKALAEQIMVRVARLLPGPERGDIPARYSQIMAGFEQLVQKHFRDRWRVSDYADALAVSATHLTRVVRDLTGASAQAYVDATIFREACRQLAYTRIDIRQIGFDLGYDDPAYFSRMFRRRVGMCPSDYRSKVNIGAPAPSAIGA